MNIKSPEIVAKYDCDLDKNMGDIIKKYKKVMN